MVRAQLHNAGVTEPRFCLHVEELSPRSSDFERVVQLRLGGAQEDAEARELRLRAWRILAEWLTQFTGYTGQMPGPDGCRYDVSLEAWRDADPDNTYIKILLHASLPDWGLAAAVA